MWMRCRFKADGEDYRPVIWPPLGPYWCTGYGGDDHDGYSIVVAYIPAMDGWEEELRRFWPEASDIDADPKTKIEFTSRFPAPDWWQGGD